MHRSIQTIPLSLKLLFALSVLVNCGLIIKYATNHYEYNRRTKPSAHIGYMNNKETIYQILPIDSTDIVFIGDSQTQRFDLFEFFKNPHLKNRGIDGDYTAGVLQRLAPIIHGKPAKLFVQIGINDIGYHQLTVDSAMRNYTKIIALIRTKSPHTTLYLESILPTRTVNRDSIVKFNARVEKLSVDNGLPYIDLYSRFNQNGKLNPNYDCGDGLHLNGKGYIAWQRILERYL